MSKENKKSGVAPTMPPPSPPKGPEGPSSFEDDLRNRVRARRAVLWVKTHEEERVLGIVRSIATVPIPGRDMKPKALYLWSTSNGVEVVDGEGVLQRRPHPNNPNEPSPVGALQLALSSPKTDPDGAIWVFRDLHRFTTGEGSVQAITVRLLRDAVERLATSKSTIIITSPSGKLPDELIKDISFIEQPLPTFAELGRVLDGVIAGVPGQVPVPQNGEREGAIKAGLGLTTAEFAGAVKESLIREGRVDAAVVVKSKEDIIRKAGLVEMHHPEEGLESVGGLDRLKQWVAGCVFSYSEKAHAFGVDPRRGLLLVGPPGTGKSLASKAISEELGVPLLVVSADQIFSKWVGDSEGKLRDILRLAETVAPCVLRFDEVEKMLSTDTSGVADKLQSVLLPWMQESKAPVLVVATSNDPMKVPPPLLSRMDAAFFVDLPSRREREEILAIHVKKKGRDPANYDIAGLASETAGYSGRELERVVREALYLAFPAGHDLTDDDLRKAVRTMVPVSVSRRDDVEAMREWGRSNAAIPAGTPDPDAAAVGKNFIELDAPHPPHPRQGVGG